jgi:uncharacterized protein YdeI (YjbR/CyaY-like superfamily)
MPERKNIMNSEIYVTNRKKWRSWLKDNHLKEKEVWLIYYKKHTGKPRIPYDDAVEEALCFGWIDSIIKKIDDERYMQKFTPRKDKSNWSEPNKKRAKKLIDNGLMAQAGLEKIEQAKRNGSWDRAIESTKSYKMAVELERLLASNKAAKEFFDSLSPSYQEQYIGWVSSAKKEETRQRRAKQALSMLSKKKKLGMK